MRKLFGAAIALAFSLTLAACGSSGSGPTIVGSDHHVTVDGTKGLAAMIDAGHFDWVNDSISGNFAVAPQKRDETMVLVSFNRSISSENAVAEMNARHLRPANLAECLAFGASIADTRSDEPIVCLGQSAQVDGGRSVPGLWGDGGVWRLDLSWWDHVWLSDYRFLAVRN
jgi:hypothetical protein